MAPDPRYRPQRYIRRSTVDSTKQLQCLKSGMDRVDIEVNTGN